MKMKNGCNLIENFRNCIRYRPALTVFTVGICLLGSALVYMSSYILTHDNILNTNIKSNWNVFVKDLNSIEWCLSKGSDNREDIPKAPGNQSFSHSIAYTVKVNVTKAFIKSHYGQLVWYAYKKDILPKEDLNKKQSHEVIKMIFDFTQVELVKKAKTQWRLVNTTMIISYNSTIPDTPLKPKRLLIPTVKVPPLAGNETQIYKCESKSTDSQPISLPIINTDEQIYKVYFSDIERTNIHLHLFSTSCFFFFTALIIVLYGLFKRRPTFEPPRGSEPA